MRRVYLLVSWAATRGEAVEKANGDVVAALKRWEPGQLGRWVFSRTREACRRAQFEGK